MRSITLLGMMLFPLIGLCQLNDNQLYWLNTSTVFESVEEHDDSLLITGKLYNFSTYNWELATIKADTLLNIVDITTIPPPSSDFSLWYADMIKTNDDHFIAVGDMYNAGQWMFLKTNPALEIDTFFVYNDTIVPSNIRAITQSVDHYYAAGSKFPFIDNNTNNSQLRHGAVYKMDTLGNMISEWEYDMGIDTSLLFFDVSTLNNNNLIAAGSISNSHLNIPFEEQWVKPMFMVIDPYSGDINHIISTNESLNVGLRTIQPLPDGSILSGSLRDIYFYGTAPYVVPFMTMVLQRINQEGELLWEQTIGPVLQGGTESQYAYQILPMPDGRYVFVGCSELGVDYEPVFQTRTAITTVFDAYSGELDWVRLDSIPGDTINNKQNFVQGATVLSSGSIVISGFNNTPGDVRGWLMKIDKNGCMNGECNHYDNTTPHPPIPTATDDVVNQAVELPLIIPNPTSGTFRLSKDIDSDLYIYDLQGRLVHKIDRQQTKGEMDIGFLDAGMYFVRGYIEGKEFMVKLVKM